MDLSLFSELGTPSHLQEDPRAGLVAGWGDSEHGCFSVSRPSFEERYDVALISAPGCSGFMKVEGMSRHQLNNWVLSDIDEMRRDRIPKLEDRLSDVMTRLQALQLPPVG